MAVPVGTTTAPGMFLAPYVPSPEAIVDRMLETASVGPGDTVYDLGSGDGRIVVAAAQRFGARAVGIELDDERFALASARVRNLGLAPRAQIVHGDLAYVDLRPATVVTLYQLPSVNAMLRPALEQQLRSGARVVTHDFPISGWEASRVITGRLDDGSPHAIYLYTVGDINKESATMAQQRTYTSGSTMLELDGVAAGSLKTVEGGDPTANVITAKQDADGVARKHLAGLTYTDLALSFGAGMSDGLYDWIAAALSQKYIRRDGSVALLDFNGNVRGRQDFFHGLISEIGFPACDGSSKDPAYMTLKIAPEYTRTGTTNGQKSSSGAYGKKMPQWLSSNFLLNIDGLDCSRVSAIDAIVVKQNMVDSASGELRDYAKEPRNQEIPNLAVSFPESDKNGFPEWFDDFVIKGNTSAGERNGTLEYLSPNLKETLFTLTFVNLGIFKLARPKMESGSEQVLKIRAEMYCEQLTFNYGSVASAGKGTSTQDGTSGVGAGLSQSGGSLRGGSTNRSSVADPIYVRSYVPSVSDKIQIAAGQQNLAPLTVPRLGRPLKFRS